MIHRFTLLTAVAFSAAPLVAEQRAVALTFDDLPANTMRGPEAFDGILMPILEGLFDAGVTAYGFVNEKKLYDGNRVVRERVRLLERWIGAGLQLGNHGFQHLDLHRTPVEAYVADIDRGGEITRELLYQRGSEPEYFRHPMLHTGTTLEIRDAVVEHLARNGLRVAPVTIDNHEWIFARSYERAIVCDDRSAAQRVAHSYLQYMDTVTSYYEAQSLAIVGREIPQILLLHANQLNADHLTALLDVYRKRGYEFVEMEAALEDPAYARPDTYTGSGGITWLHRWALTDGKRGAFFAGEPGVPPFVQRLFDDAATDSNC